VDTSDGLHADLLVIGFGKGGKTVAATMRRLGRRVVLASREGEKRQGVPCPA
jgi:choline dehydrogenase-like flavoprotein